MKRQSSEKGQALILIILAIVVIFGFAALAVDGGRIYSERRRAQAAADSAALAAAFSASQGKGHGTVKQVALNIASENGYENDPQEVAMGVPKDQRAVVVEYFNPPQSGPYKGDPLYHQVLITEKVDPIFSQIVYSGTAEFVVEAVSFTTVDCNCFSPGNAIHALNPTVKSALEFDGNTTVKVINGNIFSNSNSPTSGVKNGGSGSVTVENGEVLVVGGWSGKTENISPKPKTGVDPLTVPNVPVPDCASEPAGSLGGKKGNTLSPGNFPSGIAIHNGNWTMEPGMYCVENGFTFNGGTLTGEGVFIVMKSGALKLNGNGTAQLKYANDLKDKKENQWAGMLVYVAEGNSSPVMLSGGNDTVFSGTVFAPDAECSLGGNSTAYGYNAKIMCDTVKFHGKTTVTIFHDPDYNWQLFPMIELMQ